MPEAPVVAAPSVAAPADPSGGGGIKAAAAKAMQGMDALVTPKAAPKAEPKVDVAPEPKTVVADPKPKVDPKAAKVDPWEKAPTNLKNEHYKLKRESEERTTALERKIKEIEAKPKEQPGDAKQVEEFQKQIKQLNQRLAEKDYREGLEFKTKFEGRWNAAYKRAVEEVKHLPTLKRDADGNAVRDRNATEQDFRQLMALPPGAQDDAINNLFGPLNFRVFDSIRELQRIESEADQAIAEHGQTAEQRAKDEKERLGKEETSYNTAVEQADKELREAYPQYFAPDDNDPEFSDKLKGGFDYVDNIERQIREGNLSMEDRAAYRSVLRAQAAGFHGQTLRVNRLTEEVKTLKTELSKYRKSDPGADDPKGGGGEPVVDGEVPQGIKGAAAAVMQKVGAS